MRPPLPRTRDPGRRRAPPAIIEERCVKCGLCVTECQHSAFAVRDDLPPVRAAARSGPAGRRAPRERVHRGAAPAHARRGRAAPEARRLRRGRDDGARRGARRGRLRARASPASDPRLPQLRSTCPVVVEWVRRFYPELTAALAPIVPPYVAQARLVRALYPSDTAIVYVSPCWARKDEVFADDVAGAVDVAIGFDELKTLARREPRRRDATKSPPVAAARRPSSSR